MRSGPHLRPSFWFRQVHWQVLIRHLSLIHGSGHPLLQWSCSRERGVAPENPPFQAANGETRLQTNDSSWGLLSSDLTHCLASLTASP